MGFNLTADRFSPICFTIPIPVRRASRKNITGRGLHPRFRAPAAPAHTTLAQAQWDVCA